jgi:hypothetical protein
MSRGFSPGSSACLVVTGFVLAAQTDDGDRVQGAVEVTVAGTAQSAAVRWPLLATSGATPARRGKMQLSADSSAVRPAAVQSPADRQ